MYLRPDVHLCLIDEGAIFLDVPANAYVGLDAAGRRMLASRLVGLQEESARDHTGTEADLPPLIASLLSRGLLTESAGLGRPFAPLTPRMTHAVPLGTGRAEIQWQAMHVLRFLYALIHASISIRRGRLLRLTKRLERLKASLARPSPSDPFPDAIALVHIARRLAALFYSAKDACLLDSFVLAEFLIRHGHRPTVILAVRTKPFLAHAWVQLESIVLNDSLEHAQTLTPIAAF